MTKLRRLNQLLVDEIDAVSHPFLHPINLALITTTSWFQAPAPNLPGMRLANFICELVNQGKHVRFGESSPPQFLPAVYPELPEIRVGEQTAPPRGVEEPAGVPMARVGVTIIN